MKEKKAELRKQILKARNNLLPEQRQLWDQWILQHLIEHDRKNPCQVYLCYVNYKSEVSTKEFILWCLENGKNVFVPKVLTAGMEFYQITAWEELKEGYQGILEPAAVPGRAFMEQFRKFPPCFRMLLPGAVFDRSGNRIGYGGGFYDRWLAGWDGLLYDGMEKIGLAYQMQIVDEIPAEIFDRKIDFTITEEGVMDRHQGGKR